MTILIISLIIIQVNKIKILLLNCVVVLLFLVSCDHKLCFYLFEMLVRQNKPSDNYQKLRKDILFFFYYFLVLYQTTHIYIYIYMWYTI